MVVATYEGWPAADLRLLAQKLTAVSSCVALLGSRADKAHLVFAQSAGLGHDIPGLLRQADQSWLAEFLRSMNGEAPLRPAQRVHKHCHLGRIGAEMCMKSQRAGLAQPRHEAACFGNTDDMMEESAVGSAR